MNRPSEQQIVDRLKKQREEISHHSKLSNLMKLYDYCISLHEYRWLQENGIIVKSTLPDLKTILDDVGMENKQNNEAILPIESSYCNECQNKEDEKIRYINRNKLGMIILDT